MGGTHGVPTVFAREGVLEAAGVGGHPDEDDAVVVAVFDYEGQALDGCEDEEGAAVHAAEVCLVFVGVYVCVCVYVNDFRLSKPGLGWPRG